MSGILKISDAATLGFHAMVLLAKNRGFFICAKDIAKKFNASEAHLSKVLQRLVKSGLLKGARGPKGGFVLAKDPKEITLLEIYRSIEGDFSYTNCLFEKPICDGKRCIMGKLIEEVNTRVKDYLSKTNLFDLAKVVGESFDI